MLWINQDKLELAIFIELGIAVVGHYRASYLLYGTVNSTSIIIIIGSHVHCLMFFKFPIIDLGIIVATCHFKALAKGYMRQ